MADAALIDMSGSPHAPDSPDGLSGGVGPGKSARLADPADRLGDAALIDAVASPHTRVILWGANLCYQDSSTVIRAVSVGMAGADQQARVGCLDRFEEVTALCVRNSRWPEPWKGQALEVMV